MIETRKLPKKSIIIISTIIIASILFMYVSSSLRELKVKYYLNQTGLNNVENITVYNKTQVQNEETKRKGYLFKIKFKDLNKNQICKGLIFVFNKKDIPKTDIDCN